ncbi:hypothetical protein L218DRAFT_1059811 [Marasmius fiardii PR-910]|nr:hypothetical protein L218DRAFT_1059811 [Marasmius fiardii PR-910]
MGVVRQRIGFMKRKQVVLGKPSMAPLDTKFKLRPRSPSKSSLLRSVHNHHFQKTSKVHSTFYIMSHIDQLQTVKNAISNGDADEVSVAISDLLDDPDFCPYGGLLAFPLAMYHDVVPGTEQRFFNFLLFELEDSDDMVRRVCCNLGLNVSMQTVFEEYVEGDYRQTEWEGSRLLIGGAPYMDGHLIGDYYLTEHFLQTESHRNLLHPYGELPCRATRYGEPSKAIAWVGYMENTQTTYDMTWLGEGGRRKHHPIYVHMIAAFGPAEDRSNWEAYEGEIWEEEEDGYEGEWEEEY